MNLRLKRLIASSSLTFSHYKPSTRFTVNSNSNSSSRSFLFILFPLIKLRNLLSRTLNLIMDSFFSVSPSFDQFEDDDCDLLPLRHRPRLKYSSSDIDYPEHLYLVSFMWWNEASEALFGGVGSFKVGGTLYETKSSLNRLENLWQDDDSEIVLDMIRRHMIDCREESVSGSEDLALLSEWMFLRALKWHNDVKDVKSFSVGEKYMKNLFSLQIRVAFLCESSSLIVKIRLKDNNARAFNVACDVFLVESSALHIWDFSGQMTQFFVDERKLCDDSSSRDETLLELQVFGLPLFSTREKCGISAEQSKVDGDSPKMNGSSDVVNLYSRVNNYPQFGDGYRGACILGLTGLCNLGNTCFMNSAIQCLAHTAILVDYFLGDFRKDINFENPLGTSGKLAFAFGDLLRRLWAPVTAPVTPGMFKSTLTGFAPQFSGYNQHDSQEFLSFLLDGLHEDLNRVKQKPYIEFKDEECHPDEEIADEHWQNHLARNDSIIVDVCQGQYRSRLVCPLCKKTSITFDPFMYLSLPLPSTSMRTMTFTVLSTDGSALPFQATITVPKYGSYKDLIQALNTSCSVGDDEMLLIAEIFNHRLLDFLDDPYGAIDLIRDGDQLVAFRLPKAGDGDSTCLAVFMHENRRRSSFQQKMFGFPLITRISSFSSGFELHKQFLKVIEPFLMPVEDHVNEHDDSEASVVGETEMEDTMNKKMVDEEMVSGSDTRYEDFEFYLTDERQKIEMNESGPISGFPCVVKIYVSWPEKMIKLYDTSLLSTLPEVCKPMFFSKKPQESISLYECLEAFLKEEPLGPEDMWYCPRCKRHQQACKKLDLWRSPEILIVHLKRFSYTQVFLKNKLETFVDYPVEDLDLSGYIVHRNEHDPHHYALYAIINHYGGMGGGHYTAFVQHGDQWYEFDDSNVSPINVDHIKTPAAYVLFYRKAPR